MSETFSVVGTRIAQPDGPAKATGEAKFAGDIQMPGMLVAKVLRSPHAHALVKHIDTSLAEKLPGVAAIITPDDIAEWNTFDRGMKDQPLVSGYRVPPEEGVVNRRARHYGDAVAALAAVDEHVAEEALSLLRVEYEVLPFVLTAEAAMEQGAEQVSPEAPGNVGKHLNYPFPEGDVDQALREADLVVEGRFKLPKQEHCTQETAAAVAYVDAGGRLNVYSQCQLAHLARRELAHIFKMPVRKIRVLTPFIGGSFGQRGALGAEPIAAALALKTKRPVKLMFSREENFVGLESRTGFDLIQVRMGFKKDGMLTAIKTDMVGHLGGYMGCGPMASVIGMALVMGHYRCPNRYGSADMVMTNTPMSGAMRGFGNEVMSFCTEQLMDEAAEKLGVDLLDIRLMNAKQAGDVAALGLTLESTYLEDCINLGAEKFGWQTRRAGDRGEGRIKRGFGMCTMSHCSGAAPLYLEHSNAIVKFNEDGSVDLTVHPAPVGSHIWGALSQICAEELGIRAEDVTIVTGDTDVTLFEYGSDASRSTYAIGGATKRAAAQAKEQLLEHAAEMLDASIEDLDVKDRRVYDKYHPDKSCAVADVCYSAIYSFGHATNFSGKQSFEPMWNSPIYGAYFAEVEVDTLTGHVRVPRFLVAMDCGTAINPMAVEGQLEGGLQQGLGYALTEDYRINPKTGVVESTNYDSYKVPGTLDMPKSEIVIVDKPDPKGPFGAKGVGEPGMVGIAPAIANAIYDAVGVRLRELPMTPERVLAALEEKGETSAGR
jgi:xanthine dehydrogenase molybdenum-binding subunit